MTNIMLYIPMILGGIVFVVGMACVYAQDGNAVSPRTVRVSWFSLGLAITYSGALSYISVALTTETLIKSLSGITICIVAFLAPLNFLSRFLISLGKSPSEVSNDIMADGAIAPSERVKAAKQTTSHDNEHRTRNK